MNMHAPGCHRLPLLLALLIAAGSRAAEGEPARSCRVLDRGGEALEWVRHLRRAGQGAGGGVGGSLQVIQTAYSDPVNGNVVLLLWDDLPTHPKGVDLFVDDVHAGTVEIELAFIVDVPAGDRRFRVQPAASADPALTVRLSVLAEQPLADVTDVACAPGASSQGSTCELVVSWGSPLPIPTYRLILVDDGEFERTEVGDVTSTAFQGVPSGPHSITVAGFLRASDSSPDSLYRGTLVRRACGLSCGPVDDRHTFLRGSCDGADKLTISGPILTLSFLFLGGATPSCLAACDADADGVVDISDPVYVLTFLFNGGPPPVGWAAAASPTCERALPVDCGAPQEHCL